MNHTGESYEEASNPVTVLHLLSMAPNPALAACPSSIKARLSESLSATRSAAVWTTGRALLRSIWANIFGHSDCRRAKHAGRGTIIAANHIYNIAKPDGLTLGLVNPGHRY